MSNRDVANKIIERLHVGSRRWEMNESGAYVFRREEGLGVRMYVGKEISAQEFYSSPKPTILKAIRELKENLVKAIEDDEIFINSL